MAHATSGYQPELKPNLSPYFGYNRLWSIWMNLVRWDCSQFIAHSDSDIHNLKCWVKLGFSLAALYYKFLEYMRWKKKRFFDFPEFSRSHHSVAWTVAEGVPALMMKKQVLWTNIILSNQDSILSLFPLHFQGDWQLNLNRRTGARKTI